MYRLLALALLAAGCTAGPAGPRLPPAPAGDAFARLGWLLGTWAGEVDGVPFYEEWSRASDSLFVHRTFAWCGGDTTGTNSALSYLRREAGGRIVLQGDGLTWTATEAGDGRLVLENPDAANTQRIRYARAAGGDLTEELEANGATLRFDLEARPPVAEGRPREAPPDGRYVGRALVEGEELTDGVIFEGGRGFAYTPERGERTPLEEVCYDPPHLRFAVREATGREVHFRGAVRGDAIDGAIHVGGRTFPVRFERAR